MNRITPKKVIVALVVGALIFFVVSDPHGAVALAKQIGNMFVYIFNGIITFFKALVG